MCSMAKSRYPFENGQYSISIQCHLLLIFLFLILEILNLVIWIVKLGFTVAISKGRWMQLRPADSKVVHRERSSLCNAASNNPIRSILRI